MVINNLSAARAALAAAAADAEIAPDLTPETSMWSDDSYRHSTLAAAQGGNGPVRLNAAGLESFEEAVHYLLRDQKVAQRWDPDELWGCVAALVASASESPDPSGFIDRAVQRLRESGQTLTICFAANISWNAPPISIGNGLIGQLGPELLVAIDKQAAGRPTLSPAGMDWLRIKAEEYAFTGSGVGIGIDTPIVVIAFWSIGQQRLANRQADRYLHSIVGLCILLTRDLRAHQIYRRGPANRPGIRGLVLDRGAVSRGLGVGGRVELAAQSLVLGGTFALARPIQWYGVEPLPLAALLVVPGVREKVASCFNDDIVSESIRICARWTAQAHFALEEDDAALALGVALDALLAGTNALPGRALTDRYCYLEPEPEKRPQLALQHDALYKARSSVAHGGRSSKVDDPEFMEQFFEAVRWTAERCIALRDAFHPKTDKELTRLFEDLKLGVKAWPSKSRQTFTRT